MLNKNKFGFFIAIIIGCFINVGFANVETSHKASVQDSSKNVKTHKASVQDSNKNAKTPYRAPLHDDSNKSFASRPEVKTLIDEMVVQHHFDRQKLIALFNTVRLNKAIISKAKHPLAKTVIWGEYRRLMVSSRRIEGGVLYATQHKKILAQIAEIYGVSPSIQTAIIGIESNYGVNTGKFPVFNALANMAFNVEHTRDPAKKDYFRQEIKEYLLLCRDNHFDPLAMRGSYDGGIGQPQFMPSSFRYYAVDFDHSGSIDLMHSTGDILASIANYLKKHGWQSGQSIAIKAVVDPKKFAHHPLKDLKEYPLATLAEHGVTPVTKITGHEKAVFFKLEIKPNKFEYWLGLDNFKALRSYNTSPFYVMTVMEVSEAIEKKL